MLPNLSALHLGRSCRPCAPCAPCAPTGVLYDDIEQARDPDSRRNPGCPRLVQKRGGGWDELDAECVICQEKLSNKAAVDRQNAWDPTYTDFELLEIQALCEQSLQAAENGRTLAAADIKCGHAFHAVCLFRWVWNEGYRCPTCRTPLDTGVLVQAENARQVFFQKREMLLNEDPALRAQYNEFMGVNNNNNNNDDDDNNNNNDDDYSDDDDYVWEPDDDASFGMPESLRLQIQEHNRLLPNNTDDYYGVQAAGYLKLLIESQYSSDQFTMTEPIVESFSRAYRRTVSDTWLDFCESTVLLMMQTRPSWSVDFAQWRADNAAVLGEVDNQDIDDGGYGDEEEDEED